MTDVDYRAAWENERALRIQTADALDRALEEREKAWAELGQLRRRILALLEADDGAS